MHLNNEQLPDKRMDLWNSREATRMDDRYMDR